MPQTRAAQGADVLDTKPLGDLSLAILRATDSCQQAIGPVFGFSGEGTPSPEQIQSFHEFLFFFMHVTLRSAVAEAYSEQQLRRLQNYLAPVVAGTAVDTFCKHWPTDIKKKLVAEFYSNLNNSEMEFTECKALISGELDPRQTVVWRSAISVSSIWSRDGDPNAVLAVLKAEADAWIAAPLLELLRLSRPVLDRAGPAIDALPQLEP
jgi:hypothetical protein